MFKLKFPFFLIFMAFSLNSFAVVDASKGKIFSNPDKTVMVGSKSSSVFVIRLKSNPTTGYLWVLKGYDAEMVQPVSREYVKPSTKLIGASGYDNWTFRLKPKAFLVPQCTEITLIYAHPWDLKTAQEVKFKVVTHDS